MSSNHEDLRSKLRQHPEYTEIELLGEKKGFLLTMWGVETAKEKGVEVVPLIVDLSNRLAGLWFDEDAEDLEFGSEEMGDRLQSLIKNDDLNTLSKIVWWGLLTFDPDIELEEVQLMTTPGTLVELLPKVIDKAFSFAEDRTEEDENFESDDDTGKNSEEKTSTESS